MASPAAPSRALAALALLAAPALLLLALPSSARAEEVRVEETQVYETSGTLVAGEVRAMGFRVLQANVTRVDFRVETEEGVTLALAVRDPSGGEPAPPAVSSSGLLTLSSGRGAEAGEWKATLRALEAPEGRRVPYTLTVVVAHAETVTLREVTLQGATRAPWEAQGAWPALALVLGLFACVGGAALLRKTPVPIPPAGDNSASLSPRQEGCAPKE